MLRPILLVTCLAAAILIGCNTVPGDHLTSALSLDVPPSAAKTDTVIVRFQYQLEACDQVTRVDRTIGFSTASVSVWISGTKGACRPVTTFILDTLRLPPPRDTAYIVTFKGSNRTIYGTERDR
jgi:hypothetical protein